MKNMLNSLGTGLGSISNQLGKSMGQLAGAPILAQPGMRPQGILQRFGPATISS
jgi:hypothetical protein